MSAAAELHRGQRVGPYTLDEPIARTNLSEVWVARDGGGQRICLKRLVPGPATASAAAALGFRREAECLAQVQHPAVVRVLDIGDDEGVPYLCMELLHGDALSKLVQDGPLPVPRALELVRQIAEGLAFVHARGVVHADLKPGNVLLQGGAGEEKVKLVDFGLAADVGARVRAISGTPAYMAPEQTTLVDWPIDARTDLYALGVMAFELLTGQLPFADEDPAVLLSAQVSREPPRPTSLNSRIPPIVEKIVLTLLQKQPAQRYRSARSLAQDLAHTLSRLAANDPSPAFVLDSGADASDRMTTVFVGRTHELATLSTYLERARQGRPGVVFVGGVAGVGKSSLLREFRNASITGGATFAEGKCYEFARALPYHVLAQALTDHLHGLENAPAALRERTLARIRSAVGDLGGDLVRVAPAFATVFPEARPSTYLGEGRDRLRFLQMLTRVLETLAPPGEPLVLLLDDLQWADSGTLQVLGTLMDVMRDASLLLLLTFRSEEVGEQHPLRALLPRAELAGNRAHLSLRPLDVTETTIMMSESLRQPASALPSWLVDVVYGRTGGNPLFIGEILKALLDAKVVSIQSGQVSVSREGLDAAALPATVVDVVLRRLSTLDAATREVLGTAALVGIGFTLELLAQATGSPLDKVYAALQVAIGERLIAPAREGVYHFQHDRLQEACAGLVAEADRPPIHARILAALEASSPDGRADPFDGAEHASRAHDHARAWSYGKEAGRLALSRHANQQALDHLQRALTHAASLELVPAEIDATRREVADLLTLIGRYGEAAAVYEALLGSEQRSFERASLLSQLALNRQRAGELGKATALLTEALALLGTRLVQRWFGLAGLWTRFKAWLRTGWVKLRGPVTADRATLLRLDILARIWVAYLVSDTRRLLYIGHELEAEAVRLGPSKHLSHAHRHLTLALVLKRRPSWRSAFSHGRKAVEAARKVGAQLEAAHAMLYTADLYCWSARYLESLPFLDAARETLSALGNMWELANTHIFSFIAYRGVGRVDDALAHAEALLALGQRLGALGTTANGHGKTADALFLKGEEARAEVHLRDSLELAETHKLNMERFAAYKIQGLARLQAERFAEARASFELAMKVNETPGVSLMQFYISDAYFGFAEAVLRDPEHLAKSGGVGGELGQRVARIVRERLRRERLLLGHLGHGWRVMGLLRWRQGRSAAAMRAFRRSLDILSRQGRPGEVALTEVAMAECLGATAPDEARDRLRRARAAAEAVGLRPLVARIVRLLRAHGEATVDGGSGRDDRWVKALKEVVASSRLLIESRDPALLLEHIVEASLRLLRAERGFLFIRESAGGPLQLAVGRLASGEAVPAADASISRSVVDRVDRSGDGVAVSDVQEDESLRDRKSVAAFGLRSVLCAPLRHAGDALGVLYLDSQLTNTILGAAELELLETFVAQASVALANARNFATVQSLNADLDAKVRERTRELETAYLKLDASMDELKNTTLRLAEAKREALEKELEIARQVQFKMVPPTSVHELQAARCAGVVHPASECGGDIWTFAEGPNQRLLIILADVTGHGLGPAMITTVAKSCIDTLWHQTAGSVSIGTIFETLNEIVRNAGKGELTMTAFGVEVDPSQQRVRYCNAGHIPQVVVRRGEDKPEVTTVFGSSLRLGDQPNQHFESQDLNMRPGDRLVLFTDGVVEQANGRDTAYGLRRLKNLVAKHSSLSLEALRDTIVADVEGYARGTPQQDDVTVLVVELNPPPGTDRDQASPPRG